MSSSLFCVLFVFYVDDGLFEFLLKSERPIEKWATFIVGLYLDSLMNNCCPFFPSCFYCFLQRTLSSLELPMAVSVANGPSTSVSVSEPPSNENQEKADGGNFDGHGATSQYNGRHRPKIHDPARDLSIQVLEKFSLVTKFARDTTSQLFRENHGDGFGSNDRRHHNQSLLDSPHKASSDEQKVPDEIPVPSDPLEVVFCFLWLLFQILIYLAFKFQYISISDGKEVLYI